MTKSRFQSTLVAVAEPWFRSCTIGCMFSVRTTLGAGIFWLQRRHAHCSVQAPLETEPPLSSTNK